jgi:gas vesicle protein
MAGSKDSSSTSSGTVKEEVKQGTQQAQQTAGQMADQAKQQATSLAHSRKTQATQNLDGVAQALRSSQQQLQSNGQTTPAQVLDLAAGQVEKISGYLQSHSVNEVLADAEQFARQQPALFLGGAFAIGFALSRFLKSTPPEDQGTGTMPGNTSSTADLGGVREDVSGMPTVSVGYTPGPVGVRDGTSS